MLGAIDLIIIGGGASGLVAAISAARNGAETLILERMKRVGKKILATGNGRCNFANINLQSSNFHGQNPDFVKSVFSQFGLQKTLEFYENLGLGWKEDKAGALYPLSDKSSSILNILRYEVNRLGIIEKCQAEVKNISKVKDGFRIELSEKENFYAGKVIVATGGRAAPYMGSNGSGFELAKKMGHTIIKPFPALVQIRLKSPFLNQLAGVSFSGRLKLIYRNKIVCEETGDLLFSKYGISGLAALKISRKIGEFIDRKNIYLSIDIFPKTLFGNLKKMLSHRFELLSYKSIPESFEGLLNQKLVLPILKNSKINYKQKCGSILPKEIVSITKILKDWKFEIAGTKSWRDAQVTAGGVNTQEVNPETLESKIVKGLHFAGEVLDIDGDTGGYNLQWAWSSGYISGKFAAENSKRK